MNNYLRQTKAPIFGLISILPLLIYYEISMILISQDGGIQIRNAADVLFKRFFTALGFEGIWGSLVFFMILFISAVLLQGLHHGRHDFRFSWEYYPVMIAESGLYAMILYSFMSRIMLWTVPDMALSPIDAGYSFGAGVYEELLFRAVFLQILWKLGQKLPVDRRLSLSVALVISALIFAAAHYLGEYGDVFNWATFFARSAGGMLLGTIYLLRGLGAAVYSHAIYDIYTLIL